MTFLILDNILEAIYILFFKMTTLSLYHGLNPWPKGLTSLLYEVFVHVGPLLLNGSLEAFNIWMWGRTGLPFHIAPYAKVKGIQVG